MRRWIGLLAIALSLASEDSAARDDRPRLTIRAITAAPSLFENSAVTVRGRFRGQAMAMLPPLNRSRWDFVLTSDDAAIWVSGLRPIGWDFDLDPASVEDSTEGRWLQITGTVRSGRTARTRCTTWRVCPQIWIQATDVRAAPPVSIDGAEAPLPPPVIGPQVVFHDPVPDETDVPRSTVVRLQFSRHMIPETFSEHVRVSYAAPASLAAPPIPRFTAVYRHHTRSLEISFVAPLEGARRINVELLEGIVAQNGRPLDRWSFSFTTRAN